MSGNIALLDVDRYLKQLCVATINPSRPPNLGVYQPAVSLPVQEKSQ
jgi:hypothetical protein